ncbi:MAG: flagellar basal body rod protein FlgB [Bryobacteraceae bacterium]
MMNPIAGHLERYMDLVSGRQKLVAANVANAATPGYRTQDIDFQFEFQNAIDDLKRDPRGEPAPAVVIDAPGLKAHNDGNNVSLDREARLMSENALRFNVASQLWKGQLRQLRSAIQEGKNG